MTVKDVIFIYGTVGLLQNPTWQKMLFINHLQAK